MANRKSAPYSSGVKSGPGPHATAHARGRRLRRGNARTQATFDCNRSSTRIGRSRTRTPVAWYAPVEPEPVEMELDVAAQRCLGGDPLSGAELSSGMAPPWMLAGAWCGGRLAETASGRCESSLARCRGIEYLDGKRTGRRLG